MAPYGDDVNYGDYLMSQNYYLFTNMLSEEETRIVTSIIHHIERGGRRVGIQKIANENFVSSTFIINMCKRLGFDGYSELYYYLSQHVQRNNDSRGFDSLKKLVDNYDDSQVIQFCEYLNQFKEQKMFVDGKGFSDVVADYIAQRMAVCGFMVFNRVHFYDFMVFHENHLGPQTNIEPSIMIAISQSGETTPLINDVKTARQHGFKIVSFTRRGSSTLADISDLTFVIDEEKQSLVGDLPNHFFGHVILTFEELMGCYFRGEKL